MTNERTWPYGIKHDARPPTEAASTSIMDRMTAGKFRHLPVVDQGRLVGMISIGDVVKHRVHEMERDAAQMREYILTA